MCHTIFQARHVIGVLQTYNVTCVCAPGELVISELVISKLVISELVICEWVISELVITLV